MHFTSSLISFAARTLVALVLLSHFAIADEGMYPINTIQKLDLRSKGLRLSPEDIYSPGTIGLIDAIVQVGGCTGSFVSAEGLIITNHHCAFGAVQAASSVEHDYITDGFLARTRTEELPAKGYTVRITESYRDVSEEVLSAVSDTMALADRSKAIAARIKELVAGEEKARAGKRVEISEMFTGKSFMLFVYTFIKDVRAVYVPPRSIGEFGGENDNWIWPRHTGDFSFMRAYVAPDGSPADYSPSNVPYTPRKFLKVAPEGVDDGDAVFILGYPGRTFRHRTSHYLAYEEEIRMPYIAGLYDWQISTMENLGKGDRSIAIKHDGRIKSLANVMKNYRGKLTGMRRLDIVEKKQEEEQALQAFIDADARRKATYGSVFSEIGAVYDETRSRAPYELTLDYLRNSSILLGLGFTMNDAVRELQKPDAERESPFMEKNFVRTKENMMLGLKNYHEPTDRAFLKEMLLRASRLPADQRIAPVDSILAGGNPEQAIDRWLTSVFGRSQLMNEGFVQEVLKMTPENFAKLGDPFIDLARALAPVYAGLRAVRQQRDGALSKYSALLVDVKQQFLQKDFIPDANSTLRLTFGKIKGYTPADALYASPITTTKGVIDKTTGEEPFNTPAKLLEMAKKKEYGRFKHAKLNDVPVALLYNLDTTGGNSGSPLLNAVGDLVGVNFDRAFEATINDYAWSADYSRSIAVDIRYVLWVTEKFAGAGYLLNEMGVAPSN